VLPAAGTGSSNPLGKFAVPRRCSVSHLFLSARRSRRIKCYSVEPLSIQSVWPTFRPDGIGGLDDVIGAPSLCEEVGSVGVLDGGEWSSSGAVAAVRSFIVVEPEPGWQVLVDVVGGFAEPVPERGADDKRRGLTEAPPPYCGSSSEKVKSGGRCRCGWCRPGRRDRASGGGRMSVAFRMGQPCCWSSMGRPAHTAERLCDRCWWGGSPFEEERHASSVDGLPEPVSER
jgi:hypothetical protein